jgi:hypothetical protein
MTASQLPVRLGASGSVAPASLRTALTAAARHQPSSGELARLALSLSPVLNAPPVSRASSASTPNPADPSVVGSPSRARWSGTGWRLAKGAIFVAGTAALLLSLPRLASFIGSEATPNVPVSSTQQQPVLQRLAEVEVPVAVPVEPPPPAPIARLSPAPAREPHSRFRGVSPSTGAPPSASTTMPSAAEEQESEVKLLERARRLLQTNPHQALELVHEHERRFSAGVLVQEREIVAIDALERLGRSDEARARDESFRTRYPSSVHGKRIEVPSERP